MLDRSNLNPQKIDDAVLALLLLGLHGDEVYWVLFEDGGEVIAIGCDTDKLMLSSF